MLIFKNNMHSFLWPFVYIINYFFPENKNPEDLSDLIYFDFETTGLNPYHDKIIEYAFIQEEEDETYDTNYENNTYINELVNPKIKFEKKITDITGIHPEELEEHEDIYTHLPKMMRFVNYSMKSKDIYLVAHNCDSFDRLFLINAIKNHSDIIDYKHIKFIDTLNLCKILLPNIKSYSLKNMSKHFNIIEGNHRAMSDTIALRELYHKLVACLSTRINIDTNYILQTPSIVHEFIY